MPVPDWMMSSRKRWPKPGDVDGVTLGAGARCRRGAVPRHGDLGGDGRRRTGRPLVSPGRPGRGQDPQPGLQRHLRQRRVHGIRRAHGRLPQLRHPAVPEPVRLDPGGRFRVGVRRHDRDDLVRPGPDLAVERRRTPPGSTSGTTWTRPSATGSAWFGSGDDFWGTFTSGPLGEPRHDHGRAARRRRSTWRALDQLGNARPRGSMGDIGAIER